MMIPLATYIVYNEGFERMTALLEPKYTIPSRQLMLMISGFTKERVSAIHYLFAFIFNTTQNLIFVS